MKTLMELRYDEARDFVLRIQDYWMFDFFREGAFAESAADSS